MAKPVKKRAQRQRGFAEGAIPLSRQNYTIIGIGILVVAAGYIAMLEGSVEGFLPLVVAPILLVLGYCVIIPVGILFRKPAAVDKAGSPQAPAKT